MNALVSHLKATRPRASDTRDVRVLLNYIQSKRPSTIDRVALMSRSSPQHADLLAYLSKNLKVTVREVDMTLLKLALDIPL